MKTATQQQLHSMQQELEQLHLDLKKYSPEVLNQQPAPDQWSVLQIVHHVMIAEYKSFEYVQKKLSHPGDLPRAGWKDKWRLFLLEISLGSPLKFKAPKVVGTEQLPVQSELEESMRQWKQYRQEMADYFEGLPEDVFTKEVYRHFQVGRISLHSMLRFFQAHFKRHRKQIKRVLTQSSRQ